MRHIYIYIMHMQISNEYLAWMKNLQFMECQSLSGTYTTIRRAAVRECSASRRQGPLIVPTSRQYASGVERGPSIGPILCRRASTSLAVDEGISSLTWEQFHAHTEKYFRNLIESNRNPIVFTMHRSIWNSKRTLSVCCYKLIGEWWIQSDFSFI